MSPTQPQAQTSALITIDVQNDFTLPGAPMAIPGTYERIGLMRELLLAFRAARRPIVHIVRLYLPDGSNVDLCRREEVRQGLALVNPDTPGAELVSALKPRPDIQLDAARLLAGEFQPIGPEEWILYKPRWDAFYRTPLEAHLRRLGVDTLVFCGCNFPNCPRSSIYGASNRDFRLVLATDAVSGLYERGLEELRGIGVTLMTAGEIVDWVRRPVTAASDALG